MSRSSGCHRLREPMDRVRALMRQIALVVLLLTFAGASTVALAESTDVFLTRFIDALNANMPPHANPAAIADLFEPNATVRYMNPGVPDQKGHSEIRNYFA